MRVIVVDKWQSLPHPRCEKDGTVTLATTLDEKSKSNFKFTNDKDIFISYLLPYNNLLQILEI